MRTALFSGAMVQPDLRMDVLHRCIFGFGQNHQENIASVTRTLNELLGSTHAFFNISRPGGKIYSYAVCNPPEGFNPEDDAKGHICQDVIDGASSLVYLSNLQQSTYATSETPDPAVAFLGIETYLGHAVKYKGDNVGSLCVVYDDSFSPTAEDKKLLKVAASIVGMEYARMMVEDEQIETSYELSRYINTVLDVVWETPFPLDPSDMHYSFISPSVKKLTGRDPEEYRSINMTEMMPPETISTLISALAEEVARDKEEGVDPNRTRIIEVQERHRDGHLYWAELKVGFRRNEDGNIIALTGITRNVDARKKAELALKENERKFRDLAENIPGMAYRLSLEDNEMLFFNDAVEAITGYSAGELSRGEICSLDPLIVEEDRARVISEVQDAIGECRPFELECRINHKDGRIVHLRGVGRPVLDSEGIPSHINGVIFDITEEKKLEASRKQAEAEQMKLDRLESLGTLAGGIAHDFNNMLQALVGSLDAIEDAENVEERAEMLAVAKKACDNGKTLSNQLVTFSRGGNPIMRVISLDGPLQEWARFALSGSESGPIFDIAGDLKNVNADPNQIRQVIHNLVANANQANPDGGIIYVKAGNVTLPSKNSFGLKGGKYVEILVSDSGMGIPGDVLPRIFDLYVSTKGSGRGIGLAIAHGIIKRHGGHIHITSDVGEGTEVYVYLPTSNGKARATGATEHKGPTNGEGRILIMDDEPLVLRTFTRNLTAHGYTVTQARNGAEALMAFERARKGRTPFDLVITDLTVPGGMNGEELTKRLKAIDPSVKVVAISGYAEAPIISNPESFGIQGALAKPVEFDRLRTMVESVLK